MTICSSSVIAFDFDAFEEKLIVDFTCEISSEFVYRCLLGNFSGKNLTNVDIDYHLDLGSCRMLTRSEFVQRQA